MSGSGKTQASLTIVEGGHESSMRERLALSIVMPCLNEAETLAVCVGKAKASLKQSGLPGEVIVADNGSSDGSTKIAEDLGARVIHVREKGYGSALRGGIDAAKGKWIIMGDADDSYDFSDLNRFVEKLQQGYQLVMGCRLPSGGGKIIAGAMPWKHRWLGNPVLSWIGRLFFNCPVHDFHCGLRAFPKEAYEQMDLRTTGMEFASEMVIKATLKSLRIAEVPITLFKDGRSRPPHLRSWRDGWRHLRFMLLFSPTWLFLVPGVLLVLAGGIFGTMLTYGPVKLAGIWFDTNTLLACSLAVVLGLQTCLFGIFTRVFASTERLLSPSSLLATLSKAASLERGLLLGIMFFLVGFMLLFSKLLFWRAVHFGPLSYPESLRTVIPAVSCMTIGCQIVFSSFFLSILSLPRR